MFGSVVFIALVFALASAASVSDQKNDNVVLRDERIVGGTVTDIAKHPHLISLRLKNCPTCAYQHRCGGSIYNSTIVLTAAHCIEGKTAKNLHVYAGSNVRNGHGVMVPVQSFIIHEDYQKGNIYNNDIGILFLEAELPLDRYNIKPVELATVVPRNGVISTVTGWGTIKENGFNSDVLLEVNVPIISNDICKARLGNSPLITDSMLCAGYISGGAGFCQGDSGGPLMVNGALAGIVSWSYGCARPRIPNVNSNVAYLRPWIIKTLS